MRVSLRIFLISLALACVLLALAVSVLPWLGYELTLRPENGIEARALMVLGTMDDGTMGGDAAEDPGAAGHTLVQPTTEDGRPTNLVILLADGVGFPHLTAARAALAGARGKLTVERFPITSWHTTFNLESTYTDSAAGATALSAGVETLPGGLAVDAEGRAVATVMEEAMERGQSVAVVTDSYLWDASPAAFLAHQTSRREYDDIARQMAASGVDLAFGEARSRDESSVELRIGPFRQAGYRVVRSGNELELSAAVGSGEPVLGLFGTGEIADPDAVPELVGLVSLALDRLAKNPDGFVLFVESEEIDSGAHNGDLDRVVDGLGALDAVARRVVDFARDRDDTLVVFTGDHETGGLALAHSHDDEPLRAMWAWGHHTWAPVPVLAWGPGAEQLMGVRSSAEVGQILRRLMARSAAPTAGAGSGDGPGAADPETPPSGPVPGDG